MSETTETPQTIRERKGREPIAALTAYDFPMAKLLDAAGVPLVLVGDSLGMVVLGYPDTTHVTLEEMEHHVRAVARAKPRGLAGHPRARCVLCGQGRRRGRHKTGRCRPCELRADEERKREVIGQRS